MKEHWIPPLVRFLHDEGEDRGWSHQMCWDCWWDRNPIDSEGSRQPVKVLVMRWPYRGTPSLFPAATLRCCFCGQPNRSRIVYRSDPRDPDLACAELELARKESHESRP